MAFSGKNAVISGGCGQIGYETAKSLLFNGCDNLALLDIGDNGNVTESLGESFKTKRILFEKTDVRSKTNVKNAFKKILEKFNKIDIVINSAGIINEQNVEDTIAINLLGVMHMTQVAIDHMARENGGDGGVIANIASVCGLDYIFSVPAYSASKHGVVGFTRTLADKIYEDKFGIKFICICPGATSTVLITEITNRIYQPSLEIQTNKMFETQGCQTPQQCGGLVVDAIKRSENGSVWIIDNNQLKSVHLENHWLK